MLIGHCEVIRNFLIGIVILVICLTKSIIAQEYDGIPIDNKIQVNNISTTQNHLAIWDVNGSVRIFDTLGHEIYQVLAKLKQTEIDIDADDTAQFPIIYAPDEWDWYRTFPCNDYLIVYRNRFNRTLPHGLNLHWSLFKHAFGGGSELELWQLSSGNKIFTYDFLGMGGDAAINATNTIMAYLVNLTVSKHINILDIKSEEIIGRIKGDISCHNLVFEDDFLYIVDEHCIYKVLISKLEMPEIVDSLTTEYVLHPLFSFNEFIDGKEKIWIYSGGESQKYGPIQIIGNSNLYEKFDPMNDSLSWNDWTQYSSLDKGRLLIWYNKHDSIAIADFHQGTYTYINKYYYNIFDNESCPVVIKDDIIALQSNDFKSSKIVLYQLDSIIQLP